MKRFWFTERKRKTKQKLTRLNMWIKSVSIPGGGNRMQTCHFHGEIACQAYDHLINIHQPGLLIAMMDCHTTFSGISDSNNKGWDVIQYCDYHVISPNFLDLVTGPLISLLNLANNQEIGHFCSPNNCLEENNEFTSFYNLPWFIIFYCERINHSVLRNAANHCLANQILKVNKQILEIKREMANGHQSWAHQKLIVRTSI